MALRQDAAALALRGIAMAQLGDLGRARALLLRAGRAFGPREALARARCVVAEAEVSGARLTGEEVIGRGRSLLARLVAEQQRSIEHLVTSSWEVYSITGMRLH